MLGIIFGIVIFVVVVCLAVFDWAIKDIRQYDNAIDYSRDIHKRLGGG